MDAPHEKDLIMLYGRFRPRLCENSSFEGLNGSTASPSRQDARSTAYGARLGQLVV